MKIPFRRALLPITTKEKLPHINIAETSNGNENKRHQQKSSFSVHNTLLLSVIEKAIANYKTCPKKLQRSGIIPAQETPG
jgi:hypothetical protein